MQIEHRPFGTTADGTAVTLYTLTSETGCKAEILDYGVTIRSICVPDRSGKLVDVVLGYDTLEEYYQEGSVGATVGRFATRIAKGQFTLNGVDYQLAVNNGPNHLHGGLVGFERRVWDVAEAETGLRFSRVSPDGEEGYPGTMTVSVDISWVNGSALELRYTATSDKDTVLNLTNHSYFNLNGHGNVLTHTLQVAADSFLEGDENCLPTGRILPVDGTAMDFRTPRMVGEAVDSDEPCVKRSGGYDSNFLLRGTPAAVLHAEESGAVQGKQIGDGGTGEAKFAVKGQNGRDSKQSHQAKIGALGENEPLPLVLIFVVVSALLQNFVFVQVHLLPYHVSRT